MIQNNSGSPKSTDDIFREIDLDIHKDVYKPSDDTFLFIKHFKKYIDRRTFDGIFMNEINNVLDMGTGSGILAIFFAKYFKSKFQPNAKIFASDILQEAISLAKKNAKKNKVENDIIFIRSNLFESFPTSLRNKFNVILFNPPYLTSDPSITEENREKIDSSWNGGKSGIDLFDSFLIQAENYLLKSERVYIYFTASSNSTLDLLYSDIKSLGYEIEILKKIHVFFEDLFLHKLTRG